MCGIWGFNIEKKGFNRKWVESMIKRADERGGHSYGLYGIKSNGKHLQFKEEGRANCELILDMIKDCIAVIGQSRLASSASIDLFNTQPIIDQEYVVVHNGNIPKHKEIMWKYNYTPKTDLDSEALVPMIKKGKYDIDGAFLALKIMEYDFKFLYYSNKLPLISANDGKGGQYYCSKEWELKY